VTVYYCGDSTRFGSLLLFAGTVLRLLNSSMLPIIGKGYVGGATMTSCDVDSPKNLSHILVCNLLVVYVLWVRGFSCPDSLNVRWIFLPNVFLAPELSCSHHLKKLKNVYTSY
jgi:hypothetical protein